jgi:hypothetical protein
MFNIIQIKFLIRYTVMISIIIGILVFNFLKELYFEDWGLFKLVSISSIICLALLFLLTNSFSARKLWSICRLFNKNLYPDLNGLWSGYIEIDSGKIIDIRASIRQGLLRTELDVYGKTVKSITLECTPTVELGQKKLYYIYRSTPRNPSWPIYDGSTLLDVMSDVNGITLSGRYYTDRLTNGRITLFKLSDNININMSYY